MNVFPLAKFLAQLGFNVAEWNRENTRANASRHKRSRCGRVACISARHLRAVGGPS